MPRRALLFSKGKKKQTLFTLRFLTSLPSFFWFVAHAATGTSFLTDKKEAKIWLRGAATFLQWTARRLWISKGRERGGRRKCGVGSEDAPLNNPPTVPKLGCFLKASCKRRANWLVPLICSQPFPISVTALLERGSLRGQARDTAPSFPRPLHRRPLFFCVRRAVHWSGAVRPLD